MPARLIVHVEAHPSRVVLLPEGADCVLGRDPECDVAIDDDRVSRRHARLLAHGDGWALSDLDSKNGTWIDGAPARGQALGERAWLSLGGLLVEFRRLSDEALADDRARERQRWTTSLQAQRALVPSLGREILLHRLLRSALQVSAAERGFVLVRAAGGGVDVAAGQGIEVGELQDSRFRGSLGVIERVLDHGVAVATADVQTRPSLAQRPSVVSGGIRALVCLPLDVGERRFGALYLDSRREGAAFDELDVEILSALAAHAALAVAVAALQGELERLSAAGSERVGAEAGFEQSRAPGGER